MALIEKIFAVIDPTAQNQRALNRAVFGAKSTGASIHIYACIHSNMPCDDPAELERVETSRYQAWIKEIVQPIRDDNIEVDVEIEWDQDWRSALSRAANRANSDLIIKNSHRRKSSRRTILSSSDWNMFRTANCPVTLAKSERSSRSGNILLAVDMNDSDADNGEARIDAMLEYARAAEASYKDGTLHVLNAFGDSEHYVHVTDLEKRTGVPATRIHVVGDRPEVAIANVAEELDAELVVLGPARTTRLSGLFFGSSTEWLLNHMDRDMMVVMPTNDS